tara:strand:+ start:37 stop:327 length:291 start_codon:yes stop_codon:yes gene_type:complete
MEIENKEIDNYKTLKLKREKKFYKVYYILIRSILMNGLPFAIFYALLESGFNLNYIDLKVAGIAFIAGLLFGIIYQINHYKQKEKRFQQLEKQNLL